MACKSLVFSHTCVRPPRSTEQQRRTGKLPQFNAAQQLAKSEENGIYPRKGGCCAGRGRASIPLRCRAGKAGEVGHGRHQLAGTATVHRRGRIGLAVYGAPVLELMDISHCLLGSSGWHGRGSPDANGDAACAVFAGSWWGFATKG